MGSRPPGDGGAAPGGRHAPAVRARRRAAGDADPAARGGHRLRRGGRRRRGADGRPGPPGDLAGRPALGAGARVRDPRQPRPLRQGRRRRPAPDAMDRLGHGGGRRSHHRRRRPPPPDRLAPERLGRRPRPQRADPDRADARHAAHDGRPRRPAVDAHGRDRRADGSRRRHLRRGGDRPRPDAVRRRAGAAPAVDGGGRAVGAALPAGATLAHRTGQPARVRRARLSGRAAAHVRSTPHAIDPDGRAVAPTRREPAQGDGARVGRGVDGAGRALRARRRCPPPPGAADRHRRHGVGRRRPRRCERRDVARHLGAGRGRPQRLWVDAARAGRSRRRAARLHRRHPPARRRAVHGVRGPRPDRARPPGRARAAQRAARHRAAGQPRRAAGAQRRAAAVARPHRRRRRRRAAQARAQPPRRCPAAPRGVGREAAPHP